MSLNDFLRRMCDQEQPKPPKIPEEKNSDFDKIAKIEVKTEVDKKAYFTSGQHVDIKQEPDDPDFSSPFFSASMNNEASQQGGTVPSKKTPPRNTIYSKIELLEEPYKMSSVINRTRRESAISFHSINKTIVCPPERVICAICGVSVNFRVRGRHAGTHIQVQRRYQCSGCDYATNTKPNIKSHIQLKHHNLADILENRSAAMIEATKEAYNLSFPDFPVIASTRWSNEDEAGSSGTSSASPTSTTSAPAANSDLLIRELKAEETTAAPKQSSSLEENKKKQESIYAQKIPCQRCQRLVLLTKAKQKEHAAAHSPNRRYKCSKCHVEGHNKGSFRLHIRNVHDNDGTTIDRLKGNRELQDEYAALLDVCFPDHRTVPRRRREKREAEVEVDVKRTSSQLSLEKMRILFE